MTKAPAEHLENLHICVSPDEDGGPTSTPPNIRPFTRVATVCGVSTGRNAIGEGACCPSLRGCISAARGLLFFAGYFR